MKVYIREIQYYSGGEVKVILSDGKELIGLLSIESNNQVNGETEFTIRGIIPI